jgi:hypothetical protein
MKYSNDIFLFSHIVTLLCAWKEIDTTFADRGCHVVTVTDPYSRIFCFLDRSRYFSFR